MGDVLEFLIDGTSGLAPGGVDGKAMVVGVCSRGQVGKAYLVGPRSDLAAMLGVGPLVERVRDVLATGGQEPLVVVVPVAGQPGSVGPVSQTGEGPLITVTGTPLAGEELAVRIIKPGPLNEGTYQLSTNSGDSFGPRRTIPTDGVILVPDFGVTVTFPEGSYNANTTYACTIEAPAPTIVDVMAALESPLAVYDVEFVLVAGPTDSVDWAAMAAKADELWNAHRPTYFKAETRLPTDGESLSDFATSLLAERQNLDARFVQVCCQFGDVSDASGTRQRRNWAGLQAGRVLSIPVQRATGRVKDGPIAQGSLPEGWESVQPWLEDAGFVTAKKYAGLAGAYWGDSRTLAEDTSDYRTEEVVRTVMKAVRLERVAALKSLYDEAGDPLRPTHKGGLAYLKANIENALDTMVKSVPQELVAYAVTLPPGQDIANNGVAVETTLIATPIMRKITLFSRYVYAGSSFDPRLK